jgi:hypothetical protein
VSREYTGDGIGNTDQILLALAVQRITEEQAGRALGLTKRQLAERLAERAEAGRIYANALIAQRRTPAAPGGTGTTTELGPSPE